jgi:hypothetical protein
MAVREVPESVPEQVAASVAARPLTAEEAVEANRREYSQYVAAEQIYYGGALAHNVGDAVPAGNVERHGWAEAGKVVKTGSKAHQDLRARMGLTPLED